MTGAAVLGVHLMTLDRGVVRVGALTRDANRATAFIPDEAYLQDDDRPVLSLGWSAPGDPEQSKARLAARFDKVGLYGHGRVCRWAVNTGARLPIKCPPPDT
jgi:serine/threonine-protein kinase HipA